MSPSDVNPLETPFHVAAHDGEGAVATQMTAAIIKPFKLPPPRLFYAFSAVSSLLSLFYLLNKAF